MFAELLQPGEAAVGKFLQLLNVLLRQMLEFLEAGNEVLHGPGILNVNRHLELAIFHLVQRGNIGLHGWNCLKRFCLKRQNRLIFYKKK